MEELQPGKQISGQIDRISQSGNGILDYGAGEISLGQIKESAAGTTVEALVHDNNFAVCLDETVRQSNYFNSYKAATGQLIENPPEDCRYPGDLIGVTISGINSAGHGPGEHRGIPVRARDIEAERTVRPGESVRMCVIEIEPSRIVTTGHTSIKVRSELPPIGDEFQATVVRQSQSGKGVIESFVGRQLQVGPVTADAVGEDIRAVLLDYDAAYCLNQDLTRADYASPMKPNITQEAFDRSPELRETLSIADVTVTDAKSPKPDRSRDYKFPAVVKEAYDYACAVCGDKIGDGTGSFSTEAAHIVDFGEGGPDTVENGICLCRRHHWAFDRGLFYIDDDYRIEVSADQSVDGAEELYQYKSRHLSLPDDRNKWPAQRFLHDHRTGL